MFEAKFKGGVSESVLYFGDWMQSVLVYNVENKNGETLFLIKPVLKIQEEWVWLNSKLFG